MSSIPFIGPSFTWSNGRQGQNRIDRRFERALCNLDCTDQWPSCMYQVLVKNCSNYFPILVCLSASFSQLRHVSFHLFKMWLQNPSYLDIVKISWTKQISGGCPMLILQLKPKRLKVVLKGWNKTVFGNVHSAVIGKQQNLLEIQKRLDNANSHNRDSLISQEITARNVLDYVFHCQHLFRQKKS